MSINIRRILLGLINAALIFCLAARAQQGPAAATNPAAAAKAQDDQQAGPEPVRQQLHHIAAMARFLNLTDDQKQQFVQIQRETNQSVRAARRDDSLNEEQMQKKLKEIHAEQRRQLLALLTPEQQESLKKWWEEQKQKQQNKSGDANAQTGSQDAGSQDKDKAGAAPDDFFAGMEQDPEPAAHTNQQTKKPQPNN